MTVSIDVLLWTWCIGGCVVLAALLHTMGEALIEFKHRKQRPQFNHAGITCAVGLALLWPLAGLVAVVLFITGRLRLD